MLLYDSIGPNPRVVRMFAAERGVTLPSTKVDLRDPASIEAGVAAVGGKIDALFNCAGLPGGGGFPPLDTFKVNFAGTRHLTD